MRSNIQNYRSFEEEVVDRLARVEEKQDMVTSRLLKFMDDPCHLRGCELHDTVIEIQEKQRNQHKLLLLVVGVFITSTGTILASIIWSPALKVFVGG